MPTISNLPSLTTATNSTVIPVLDTAIPPGTTKKLTLAQLSEFVLSQAGVIPGGAGGGYTGSQGLIGYTGSRGLIGYTGSAGPRGFTGFVGSQGAAGAVGFTGSTGIGYTGSASTIPGPIGYTGSAGIGYTGSASDVPGPMGYTGSQGDIGYTGSQGIPGPIGYTGSVGIGYTGSQGSAPLVSVQEYGAVGDGTTDDTAAIQTAIDAMNALGGGKIYLPRGVYRVGKLTVYSNIWIEGEGRSITTLKLKDNANTDLIYGNGADALWGTNTVSGGIQNVGLFNITLDGNRTNNTSGHCIAMFGDEFYFQNLSVTQAPNHGIKTEWYRGDSTFGMESHYINVRIDTCGWDCWNNNGPHDSVFFNVICIDASQAAENTYNGITVGPLATGRFIGCHVWTRAASKRCAWAIKILGGSNEFVGCHFEGAWFGNVGIFSNNNVFDDSNRYYAAWNGVNIYLGETASLNVIKGYLEVPGEGRPACKGIVLGGEPTDYVSGNIIDVAAMNQNAGSIDFTNSDGNNKVIVKGWQTSGPLYVGTPRPTDIYDIRIQGATPSTFTNISGSIGYTGSQGPTGYTGSQGSIGYTGSQGSVGYTGSQGESGVPIIDDTSVAGDRVWSSLKVSTTFSSKLGYKTGNGGAVEQTGTRTSAVTLDKLSGTIRLASAAGNTSWTTFTFNNSTIEENDTIVISQKSGTDQYMVFVTGIVAGSCQITFATTGGTTTEQPVFTFSVLAGSVI